MKFKNIKILETKTIIKLGVCGLVILSLFIFFGAALSVVDSAELGIKFHKWSTNEDKYGGVEGTCSGWVFCWPWSEAVFTYPAYIQRKEYEAFSVNAKDASIFTMKPMIAYQIDPGKVCDIFVKYRKPVEELESGYIRTCIYEAYRTCANKYASDSLMSNRANFEADVRAKLEKTLMAEGFIVTEFTSEITPPASLTKVIDEKNAAIQSALKANNKVKEAEANAKIKVAEAEGAARAMKVKADAEAYYNKTISASLSPMIVQEDFIEKWDGKFPNVYMGSGAGTIMDISKMIK